LAYNCMQHIVFTPSYFARLLKPKSIHNWCAAYTLSDDTCLFIQFAAGYGYVYTLQVCHKL
jgi:hypothetical protein